MLGWPVFGSRTWMWTIAAPALAASIAEAAICSGVTGTAGFLATESADPVTAHEIMILRCTAASLRFALIASSVPPHAAAGYGVAVHGGASRAPRTLHPFVRCAKPPGTRLFGRIRTDKKGRYRRALRGAGAGAKRGPGRAVPGALSHLF